MGTRIAYGVVVVGALCWLGQASSAAARQGVPGRDGSTSQPTTARTWYVVPTGNDGGSGAKTDPFATIRRGMEVAADGDQVLLMNGRYVGSGNRELDFLGKAIVVRSASGAPDSCIVEADGFVAFYLRSGELEDSILMGVKIVDASVGVSVSRQGTGPVPHPGLRECVLDSCDIGVDVAGLGSAVRIDDSLIRRGAVGVLFRDGASGGRIENTSFVAHTGDGLRAEGSETLGGQALECLNCEFAQNDIGVRHLASFGEMRLIGCDVHDNVGWGAVSTASQAGGFVMIGGTVHGNGIGGVNTALSFWDSIADCEIAFNRGPGILTGFDNTFEVINCRIHHNTGNGLEFDVDQRHDPSRQQPVTVSNCDIYANGGCGIDFDFHSLHHDNRVENCRIYRNVGAGVRVTAADFPPNSPRILIDRCSVVGNECGLQVRSSLPMVVESSVIAFNDDAAIDGFPQQVVSLACSDLFGNDGGDWVDEIAGQLGVAGNFSADPLFCAIADDDYTLSQNSPCAAGNHPDGADCGLVGALGVGCPAATAVDGSAAWPAIAHTCYPNPFNAATTVSFDLPESPWTTLTIYAIDGRRVRTLAAGPLPAGRHAVSWDGCDDRGIAVASGTYFCRVESGPYRSTRKLVLAK